MADLQIDFGALERAKSSMTATAETLRNARMMGDQLAGLTGHPRLAGTVRDFAGNWEIHRAKLLASITHLEESIAAVEETFADVDHRLGREAGAAIAKGSHP